MFQAPAPHWLKADLALEDAREARPAFGPPSPVCPATGLINDAHWAALFAPAPAADAGAWITDIFASERARRATSKSLNAITGFVAALGLSA